MILLAHSYYLRNDPKQLERMKPYPPLSTLLTGALVRKRGHDIAFFDATFADGVDAFVAALDETRPAVEELRRAPLDGQCGAGEQADVKTGPERRRIIRREPPARSRIEISGEHVCVLPPHVAAYTSRYSGRYRSAARLARVA